MPKKTFFQLSEEKRLQITGGAMLEFYENIYQDVSITNLIKRMEIPAGSFYQYFEDKKDVYFYVLSIYMDRLAEESNTRNIKLDLFDMEKNNMGTQIFTETRKDPMYHKIFVENFNNAPYNIKLSWTFEQIVNEKYLDIYDFSFFDNEDIPSIYKENKELLISLVMAIPSVVNKFVTRKEDPEKYSELYRLCINLLKEGMLCDTKKKSNSKRK